MKTLKTSLLLFLMICSSMQTIHSDESEESIEEPHHLFVNDTYIDLSSQSSDQKTSYRKTMSQVSRGADKEEFWHILQSIDFQTKTITLTDGAIFQISDWYIDKIKSWEPKDRLRISMSYLSSVSVENVDKKNTSYGTLQSYAQPEFADSLKHVFSSKAGYNAFDGIKLKSGWQIISDSQFKPFFYWNPNDIIFIFHDSRSYSVFNVTQNKYVSYCTVSKKDPKLEGVLELEENLNNRVIGQEEATKVIATAILNYHLGLKNPDSPVGVFLFLGTTGVGKTELAKAIADEYYKTQKALIRFDMSNFVYHDDIIKLIGSPPGYINNEDGGQLTNAIYYRPKSIVLLDEIEKAHSSVQKFFLPVFDEGYITDAHRRTYSCKEVLFIMTSNLEAEKIAELSAAGYESNEILEKIEPMLMKHLSPELYNRVQPVLFNTLKKDSMYRMVDLMISNVTKNYKKVRGLNVEIDSTVREYLIKEGFHPTLGARPLKKLIEKKVTSSLAHAIAHDGIPYGSNVTLYYMPLDDSWHVYWNIN
jgi:broad-specificity NMP kinase